MSIPTSRRTIEVVASSSKEVTPASDQQQSLETKDAAALLKALILCLGDVDNHQQALYNQFIDKWIPLQFNTYHVRFSVGSLSAALVNIQNRFDWLTGWLKTYDTEYAHLFPAEWHVAERFVSDWCTCTRGSIESLLNDMQTNRALTARDLKTAIKATFLFEGRLDDEFKKRYPTTSLPTPSDKNQGVVAPSSMLTSDVRNVLPRSVVDALIMINAPTNAPPAAYKVPTFKGTISACFEDYYQVIIDEETKWLSDAYSREVKNEEWRPFRASDTSKVFPSIRSIFDYMSKCRQRIFILGMPKVMVGIIKVFEIQLANYGSELRFLESKVDLSSAAGKTTLCTIINTVSYIVTMSRAMCAAFKSDLPMHQRDVITMQTTYDLYIKFNDAVVHRLSVALFNASNICYIAHPKTYVADLKTIIQTNVELLRDALLDVGSFTSDFLSKSSLVDDMPAPENPIGKLLKTMVKGVALRLADLVSSCNTSTESAVTLQYMREMDTIEALLCSLPSLYHHALPESELFVDYVPLIQQQLAPQNMPFQSSPCLGKRSSPVLPCVAST
jgi:hypothetical protein